MLEKEGSKGGWSVRKVGWKDRKVVEKEGLKGG